MTTIVKSAGEILKTETVNTYYNHLNEMIELQNQELQDETEHYHSNNKELSMNYIIFFQDLQNIKGCISKNTNDTQLLEYDKELDKLHEEIMQFMRELGDVQIIPSKT